MVLNKVRKTIQRYHLFQRKDRLLVAYSGGIDSTALVHLLLELREEWELGMILAHFNHRLRDSANEDERLVRKTAQKYSLPLVVEAGDVRRMAETRKLSLEEAGRSLRYEFLKRAGLQKRVSKIATGHTLDDQAETLLMRLLRGSGRLGLGGISPVAEGKITRPLIEAERRELLTYLETRNIPYRVDESNFDRRFFRNRIRMELIPYIQKNFEPRIIPILGKTAALLQQEEDWLQDLVEEETQKSINRRKGKITLNISALSSLSLALRRRVVREYIRKLKGDLLDISFEDIESILNLQQEKEFHLKKDLVLIREGNEVKLKGKKKPRIRFEYSWEGKGLLDIKEIGLKFLGRKNRKRTPGDLGFDDKRQAFLDLAQVQFPLLVRSRREGDRYQPLGAPGTKKLKEIMRAKGIPLSERDRRPVFLSGDEIIWILGLPISEKHKVSSKTEQVLTIRKL